MARRATPRDRGEDLVRRTHQAGVAHFECGDTSLARSVLEQAVDLSMAGPARARVLLDLGMGLAEAEGWRGAWAVFEAARGEAGDDLALRARIEQNLGYAWLFRGDLAASERHARAALQLAEELQEPRVMAEAFQAYPFVEFLLGRGVDQELLDRGIALEGHMEGEFKSHVLRASFVVAQLLKFTDRLDEARRTFTELLGDAAAHGVESPIPQIRYHLAELECRAGNWDAAMEHARESRATAQRIGMGAMSSEGHFAVGLVEAHLGRADPARLAALEGLRVAEAAGEILLLIPNLSVLGFLELSLGRPAEADAYLSRAVELEQAMGVREPAYFRIVPDEVEALVALGRLDEAEALLAPFEDAGRSLDRAWAMATGARCRALVLAARGDLEAASAAADEAVGQHERLPLPFELGRTLLVSGTVQRRAKRKREARDTLTQALEIFEGLGAAAWAERTRAELARIGGRAASSVDLTPTEDRVAELVAAGSTNREVADALFVSVHTVEANLKRIYRKLGIRSRTELASTFPSRPSGSLSQDLPVTASIGTDFGDSRVGALPSLGIGDRYPREGRDHEHESGNHRVLRPTGAVHVLDRDRVRSAAAALILSAVALTVAGRGDRSVTSVAGSGTREAASIGALLWDAGKLEAMEGRVLAETVRAEGSAALWDAGKLEAMEGRVLAETVRAEGSAALWDAGKLQAMEGRVLAG